jgi:hypothetical protein
MQAAAGALERAKSLHTLISAKAAESERIGRLTDKTARTLVSGKNPPHFQSVGSW